MHTDLPDSLIDSASDPDAHREVTTDCRTIRQRCGDAAEALAARYLQRCGLWVLERGYRRRIGELDLVCLDPDDGCIVFVEVRYRAGFSHGGPLASVNAAKRRKLHRTARAWLQGRRVDPRRPARIDVIGICPEAPRQVGYATCMSSSRHADAGGAPANECWQRVEGQALYWCRAVT